jgi:hypothetical protein
MPNRSKAIRVDAMPVYEALKDLPRYVGINAVEQAVRYALKPEVSKVKMQIAVSMAGNVIDKGIKDYQRSIGIIVKKHKNLGTAYGRVGAERGVLAASSHRPGKATVWSRLAHLFEYGTKRGIEPMPAIEVVAERDRAVMIDRYRGVLGRAIEGQVKRYEKIQAIKAGK